MFRDKEEKEQQNLSLMLMFVVMVFMLCNVLAMVSNILEACKVGGNIFVQLSCLNGILTAAISCTILDDWRR